MCGHDSSKHWLGSHKQHTVLVDLDEVDIAVPLQASKRGWGRGLERLLGLSYSHPNKPNVNTSVKDVAINSTRYTIDVVCFAQQ